MAGTGYRRLLSTLAPDVVFPPRPLSGTDRQTESTVLSEEWVSSQAVVDQVCLTRTRIPRSYFQATARAVLGEILVIVEVSLTLKFKRTLLTPSDFPHPTLAPSDPTPTPTPPFLDMQMATDLVLILYSTKASSKGIIGCTWSIRLVYARPPHLPKMLST